MKLAKIKNRIKSVVMASALSLALLAGFPAVEAQAATGSVYTCTINRCYAHPVTGAVEDSGGAGSYATGQGMVEGCVYPTGILEVADDGNYYLTIRLSLMDYTSGHDFQVQSVGDSGWSSTGYAQTGTGSDSNGTTADVVIQDDKPSKIPIAINIGKQTKKIVWQNIILAFVVKAIVLVLGAGGLATMWEAVFADVGVSLIAILNAVRIQKMKFE